MKSLQEYITEGQQRLAGPAVGDSFDIELDFDQLIESYIVDVVEDGIVLNGDADMMQLLESAGCQLETIRRYGPVGADPGIGYTRESEEEDDCHTDVSRLRALAGLGKQSVNEIDQDEIRLVDKQIQAAPIKPVGPVDEAEYHGHEVSLGKPQPGDVKKSKVYVRGPKGNVVKVNFGDKTMRIKKSNPARRRSFRARHHCDTPGPRWKARYWSCRAW
jgi:hypothetical protein